MRKYKGNQYRDVVLNYLDHLKPKFLFQWGFFWIAISPTRRYHSAGSWASILRNREYLSRPFGQGEYSCNYTLNFCMNCTGGPYNYCESNQYLSFFPSLKCKLKCLYLYWITYQLPKLLSLKVQYGSSLMDPVLLQETGNRSTCTTGNRSTWRKPAKLSRVKLDNTLLTYDQGSFNQITIRSRNRTLVTVVTNTCTTTVPQLINYLISPYYTLLLSR